MEKKTLWQYQRLVWSRAARTTWDKLGIQGAVLGFVAAIIATFFIRATQARTDINAGDVVISAAIFLGLCVVALAIYAFREPVNLHNEQIDQINQRESDIRTLENNLEKEKDKSARDEAERKEQKKQQEIAQFLDEMDKENALTRYDAEYIAREIQKIEESNPSVSQKYRAADIAYRLWRKEFNDVSGGITAEELEIKRERVKVYLES